MKYVLITPARNEESFIQHTLDSVCAQTLPPERWVIVDDGSKDRTAEIVESYARRFPWIELLRRPAHIDRSFAGKVHAFNAGLERARLVPFEVLGNLDADITFEPGYLEFLMQRFAENPKLGVAGTPFVEDSGYDSARDSFEGDNYVAGGCQLFRRACFEEIGGYVPNPAGGVDWIAVMSARMKGWRVQSFSEKRFHHHRKLGTAEKGVLGALFDYGKRAYYLGGSPLWQIFRGTYRMAKKPFVIGGIALLGGYGWAGLRRMKRPVSAEMIRFHRRDQMQRLAAIFRTLLKFKRVDNFRLATESKRTP